MIMSQNPSRPAPAVRAIRPRIRSPIASDAVLTWYETCIVSSVRRCSACQTLPLCDAGPTIWHVLENGRQSSPCASYAALAETVEKSARAIARSGIEPGEHIGLFAATSPGWVSACLALLHAGAVTVPVDTQADDEQLQHILDDAAIDFVLADEARASRLEDVDFDGRVLRIDDDDGDGESFAASAQDGETDTGAPAPDDVALLFYTSGTTGPPKGVPLRHRHLQFQVTAVENSGIVTEDDRLLLPLPLHHVYPLVIGVFVPLSMGLPIVIPHAMTGPEFIRAVRETDATVILGVPRLYASLVEGLDSRIAGLPWPLPAMTRATLALASVLDAHTGVRVGNWLFRPLRKRLGPRLRLLASGGSPLSPDLARRLGGFGWDVAAGYGLTETSPLLTINPPGSRRADTVGRPLDEVEIRIEPSAQEAGGDDDDSEVQQGEILARGPGVFDGYLNLDDATEKSFTKDGWFRTGDLGWLDSEGYLHVAGRKSTMIVTASGENIRTEALEDAYAAHPAIGEIGILKADDRLAAVIVPDTSELRDAGSVDDAIGDAVRECAQSQPSYMRLDSYRIARKPLARTRLGKIRRQKLEQLYDQLGSGDDSAPAEPLQISEMSPPDREMLLDDSAREVWGLLCERYPDRSLAPDSDLRLELGVDSMGWLDLSMDIAAATGIELDEAVIAEIDTVRDLLEAVSGVDAGSGEAAAPLEDPNAVLSDEQKAWLERPSGFRRRFAHAMFKLNALFMRAVFRVRSTGEGSAADAPCVFAPNHSSFLDAFAVAAVLPERVLDDTHWGGWTGYTLRNRVFRWLSRAARVVPVDPDRATISSLAGAVAVLRDGRNLVWFPEGQRAPDGELQSLRTGIGAILEAVPEARVVPVYIDGAFEAWPHGRRLPRPHRIRVAFGEPVAADDLADSGEGDSRRARIVDAVRNVMKALQQETAKGG